MPSPWTSKAMWKAVAYVVVLHLLTHISSRYLWGRINVDLPEELLSPDKDDDTTTANRKFWIQTLPKSILWNILITPMNYRWQCWLEWMFPGRRRQKGMPITTSRKQSEKMVDVESDDEREEEIMKRLIAKGKVQRSGLSWFNTFVKWILDIIFANLFFGVLSIIWEGMWNRHSLPKIWGDAKFGIIPTLLFGVFSFDALAVLISFIIIPVQHRLPFEAALNLAWTVFVGAFMNVFIPFVLSHDFTQEFIRNQTEAVKAARNATASNETFTTTALKIGEL